MSEPIFCQALRIGDRAVKARSRDDYLFGQLDGTRIWKYGLFTRRIVNHSVAGTRQGYSIADDLAVQSGCSADTANLNIRVDSDDRSC